MIYFIIATLQVLNLLHTNMTCPELFGVCGCEFIVEVIALGIWTEGKM